VDPITPYWHAVVPFTITATASDSDGYVRDVALYYRYSGDNLSWGDWALFEVDRDEPWSWSFTAPMGDGYYEFYSVARDNDNNEELAKLLAEARCGIDRAAPSTQLISPANGTTTDDTTPTFDWGDVSDLSGVTYTLVIDNDDDFSSPLLIKAGLQTSMYKLITREALAEGTYYWRVWTVDGAGNGTWTDAWSLIIRVTPPPPVVPIPLPMFYALLMIVGGLGGGVVAYLRWFRRIPPKISLKRLRAPRPAISLERLPEVKIKPAIPLKRLVPAPMTLAPALLSPVQMLRMLPTP